jgi:hypothetical protein
MRTKDDNDEDIRLPLLILPSIILSQLKSNATGRKPDERRLSSCPHFFALPAFPRSLEYRLGPGGILNR